MKVILVRHGESEHNIGKSTNLDSTLTKNGERQAELLGKKLKKEKVKIDTIYTSSMIRSKQTGEIISKIIKVPIKENFEGLSEYPSQHLKSKLRILFNLRLRRLKKFLKEITKVREKDKTIMIVAHGITNRIIIGVLLQIPLKRQLLRLQQKNTALNILDWNQDFKNWRLDSMNDISHLKDKFK